MREKNMIYIFTEDSRDGKELIESVVKILYPDYDIKVDTLQGIYNAVNKLKDKIEQNNIDFNNDYIIVVIDNILENIDIRQDIKDLNIFCRKYSNIKLINTQSFEVEILRVDDIEYLGDVSEYNKYFRKLKNITNTTAMTMKVKNDEVYEPLINKAVELKRKKRSRYSDAQILASISKLILNKVFAGNANLKPI
jgi:predicted nucleic-acid-binding protein